ncbi:MAG TPA: hypothetical protein VFJ16_17020 [Longimicrobium sp.]|nr:hypothetical protein [Longimicrobium sp.]
MRSPILTALVALILFVADAHTQRAGPPAKGSPRVPLTIAVVNELPHLGAPYEILRRTSGANLDVVLLPEGATVAQFSDAIRGVLTARAAGGDTATEPAVLRVRQRSGVDLRPVFPWARRVLSDVEHAPVRPLEGVGMARTVQIWLPAQHPHTRPQRSSN